MFARTGTTWTQEAYIKPSTTVERAAFGSSVTLDADAGRLAVGAPGNSTACVFARTGTAWTQETCFSGSSYSASDSSFGTSVSLSGDGSDLAIGAPQQFSSNGFGAAYLFARTDTAWAQEAFIKPSSVGFNDYFGVSVSLAADGGRLAIGAHGEDSNATGIDGDTTNTDAPWAGAAYVFDRTSTGWAQKAYLKASNTEPYDQFGYGVSLAGDGTRLAVGAYAESSGATPVNGDGANNDARRAGAAYIYALTDATWAQEAYIKPSNAAQDAVFGFSVALAANGRDLAVGAPQQSSGERLGDAYAFHLGN